MAMELAEMYKSIPGFVRKALIEGPVNLLPSSPLKKTRIRDIQRFFTSANEDRCRGITAGCRPLSRTYELRSTPTISRRGSTGRTRRMCLINGSRVPNGLGVLDATLLTDQMTYLPNDLLVKVDIATMANSLEARSPFLDHKLIEFAASLPENLKMSRLRTKSLLKKVAARLVPPEVVYRRKMGFGVPVGKWFRGEMKGFVRDVLLSETSLKRGIIKPAMIERYVTEHTNGEQDHAFQIWSLLMLELWFQRFID